MMDDELKRYIEHNLRKGHHPHDIIEVLVKHGHDKEEVTGHVQSLKKKRYRQRIVLFAFGILAGVIVAWLIFNVVQPARNESGGSEIITATPFAKAINEKNEKLCYNLENEREQSGCVVVIALVKNDSSLCRNLPNQDEFSRYRFNNDTIVFSSQDECWNKFGRKYGANYCNEIVSLEGKEICKASSEIFRERFLNIPDEAKNEQ
jgi:hypothetical protein